MISKRIIPLFLLRDGRLVKGTGFKDYMDVGDPLSQAMIYDAQGADEIIMVDIEALGKDRIADTGVVNKMINKCRLPIGVGGGIKSVEDARRFFESGADKIVMNTHAVLNTPLVKELAREFGSQSVVASVDVRENGNSGYDVHIFSGRQKADINFETFIKKLIDCGAGELIITSMDKEGTLSGFDYRLYNSIRDIISVPLIASGGAGCYDDIVRLFKETDCDACAIGKMLFLRDYDIVRIKSYIKGKAVSVREA